MPLSQLLHRQRGPEVGIVIAQDPGDLILQILRYPAIAGSVTASRDQSDRTFWVALIFSLPPRSSLRKLIADTWSGKPALRWERRNVIDSVHLPGEIRGDPADRFLIATARSRRAKLTTHDEKIIAYGRAGHVKVLEV